ncbi:unnamed protein product [Effrenium voratum]|uniref:Uncharacterized protein n=1 Tax=Effrenium voratum TaxID=2562239 RepID=A0AA36MRB6_9DINO|nr:unnamed protein product [Effrenium voratum]
MLRGATGSPRLFSGSIDRSTGARLARPPAMSGRANHEEVEPPGLELEEGSFWQLHRQLADCHATRPASALSVGTKDTGYVADIAKLGKRVSVSMPPCSPPEMLFEQDRRDSIDSHFRTSKSNKKDTLKPPSRAPSIENPKSSETPTVAQRKDRTLKTLLNVQGLQPTASETFDLRELDLKVHERWDAARAKQQKHFAKKSLEDGRSKTQAMRLGSGTDLGAKNIRRSEKEAGRNRGAQDLRQPVMTVAEELPRRRCVLHPGGRFKTCWNVMVAACVLHDLLVIPLNTFSFPQNVFWDLTSWSVQVFWNLDFFVSLFSAFYDEGALVMSLPRIAAQYARTWMLFDVTMISMDWCFRIMDMVDSEQAESIMWSKSLRMLRFLRLMRMLRWVKLRRINEIFQEFFHSQAASLYYGLFHSIATLMVLNHLIACAWFATSHMDEMNWVTDLGIHNDPAEYQYLTCMNWAFAQLGVGSSPAKATNSLEMVFCIVIAFRSLITSSTLISTVSNLMAGLSKIKEDENTEFRLLRCYLAQNNIPIVLGQKITHFLQYQYTLRQEARRDPLSLDVLHWAGTRPLSPPFSFGRAFSFLLNCSLLSHFVHTGASCHICVMSSPFLISWCPLSAHIDSDVREPCRGQLESECVRQVSRHAGRMGPCKGPGPTGSSDGSDGEDVMILTQPRGYLWGFMQRLLRGDEHMRHKTRILAGIRVLVQPGPLRGDVSFPVLNNPEPRPRAPVPPVCLIQSGWLDSRAAAKSYAFADRFVRKLSSRALDLRAPGSGLFAGAAAGAPVSAAAGGAAVRALRGVPGQAAAGGGAPASSWRVPGGRAEGCRATGGGVRWAPGVFFGVRTRFFVRKDWKLHRSSTGQLQLLVG